MAIDKNTIMKEAQKYVAKGMFDKAIAEWKKLVRESPNDANIFNTIGDLCLKKNSKTEAVEAYKRAADILAEDGFTSKAIALYKKVLNIDPTMIQVHLALGDMNAEKGLTGNALENYKNVFDSYKKQNKMGEALGIYQKMADLNPSNIAFRIKLAEMYAKEKMNEDSARAYLAAADVHVSKNSFQDARQLFEKVLAVDPGNYEVYHKAGILYLKEGKFVEACKALKRAFEGDPSNTELVDTYLEALTKAGKDSDAELVIKRILAEDMSRVDLRERLYNIYLGRKDYERALVEATAIAENRIETGDNAAAEETFQSFLLSTPHYAPGRQKMAEFYIAANKHTDAATELLQAADLFIAEGDRDAAKAVLAQAIEVAPDLQEAKDRLANLQATVPVAEPQPESEMAPSISETPVGQPEARPVIEAFSTPSEVIAEPEPPQELSVSEVLPVAATGEEDDPAVSEAITEAEVLIKYGLTTKAIEQLESLTSKFPETARIRIKLRDLYHESGSTDKAVLQALLAMALLTKQGKDDQAASLLESTRIMAPEHPAVVARIKRSAAPPLPEQPVAAASPTGTFEEIAPAEVVPEFPGIALEETMFSPPPDTRERSTPITDGPSSALEEVPHEAAFPSGPVSTDEITFDGLDKGIAHFDEDRPAADPLAGTAYDDHGLFEDDLSIEPMPSASPEGALDQPVVVDQPESAFDVAPEESTAEEAPLEVQEQPALESTTQAAQQIQQENIDVSEIWAEAEFYFQQGLFDEAKKHYAKIISLTPSDRRVIDRLSEISREEDETREFSKLADAVEGLEGYTGAEAVEGELATSASDEEAVRSLMQEIQQLNKQQSAAAEPSPPPPPPPPPIKETVAPAPKKTAPTERPAPPAAKKQPTPTPEIKPAAPQRPAPVVPQQPVQPAAWASAPAPKPPEEDYFDLGTELKREKMPQAVPSSSAASDDFFDLAAELRDELSNVSMPQRPAGSSDEQSLDDIFEEFKKGVEQQTIKEDADTHYNLGVAYKEMGLLDDAISEFIMTPEEEPKFVQSRYMLGLCYMEQGDYQNAIGEIQNALDYADTFDGGENLNRTEIHYDLGLAFQGAGNIEGAMGSFQKVLELDPKYRDAAAKLKELNKGDFISLEQLKDDIEKEISSKFLEEGVRIEREEKTRKNERVKN